MTKPMYGGSESHPLYTTWLNMRQRCYNKNKPQYKDWGGRGITVCDEWNGANGFVNFAEYMGNKPTPQHSLDRIDNDGNYEPGNVRWATRFEQAANMSHVSEYPGVSKTTTGKWRARVKQNGKEIWLGSFKEIADAIKARKEWNDAQTA